MVKVVIEKIISKVLLWEKVCIGYNDCYSYMLMLVVDK